jgi:hypothetical protein
MRKKISSGRTSSDGAFGLSRGRLVVTAFSTVLLGAVGSGIWELVARPGLTTVSTAIIKMLSLVSKSFRDNLYESAALDPTPIPPLIFLMLVPFSVLFISLLITVKDFQRGVAGRDGYQNSRYSVIRRDKGVPDKGGKGVPGQKYAVREHLEGFNKTRRRIRGTSALFVCIQLVVVVYAFGAFAVINQAVFVRRTFLANMQILGPYLSGEEEKYIRSRFASMRTREDFLSIEQELSGVANKNKIRLYKVPVW